MADRSESEDTRDAAPALESPKRRRLRLALSALVWLALALAAVPFIASVSGGGEEAGPAPMHVSVRDLGAEQARRVLWAGRPVWILHRSRSQLDAAGSPGGGTVSAYVAFYGDVEGCSIVFRGPGGFRDPCSGARYDARGRPQGAGAATAAPLKRPAFHLDGHGYLVLGVGSG